MTTSNQQRYPGRSDEPRRRDARAGPAGGRCGHDQPCPDDLPSRTSAPRPFMSRPSTPSSSRTADPSRASAPPRSAPIRPRSGRCRRRCRGKESTAGQSPRRPRSLPEPPTLNSSQTGELAIEVVGLTGLPLTTPVNFSVTPVAVGSETIYPGTAIPSGLNTGNDGCGIVTDLSTDPAGPTASR